MTKGSKGRAAGRRFLLAMLVTAPLAGWVVDSVPETARELESAAGTLGVAQLPVVYSTYAGGAEFDAGLRMAADEAGNVYVTGWVFSTDFPTVSAVQPAFGGGAGDAFVMKIGPAGDVLFSTYLGGSSADRADGVALAPDGSIWITGRTASTDFPTANAPFPAHGGDFDAFLVQLSPSGSQRLLSTYLGGTGRDLGHAVGVDSEGRPIVVGGTTSADFPTTAASQPLVAGGEDAFVSRFDSTGAGLEYSTYLGGTGDDFARALSVDPRGFSHVAGQTGSADFPTLGAVQGDSGGGDDAFATRFDSTGLRVLSTYLGGGGTDFADGVFARDDGSTHLVGQTASIDFPTQQAIQGSFGGGPSDAWAAKLGPSAAQLVSSTYLGGAQGEFGHEVVVGPSGNVWITGDTFSSDFPTRNNAQVGPRGDEDFYVVVLGRNGSPLLRTFMVGAPGTDSSHAVAVDPGRNLYIAGHTASSDFPTRHAAQPAFAGTQDSFSLKIAVPLDFFLAQHSQSGRSGIRLEQDVTEVAEPNEKPHEGGNPF